MLMRKKGYGEFGIEIVKRVHQTTVIYTKQQQQLGIW